MRTKTPEQIIMSAKATTGIGSPILVEDFQHIFIELSSQSSGNFTVKFQISNADTMPDFSSAQSATNPWDYVQVKDLEDNAAIDGDTGVAFAGTDDVRQLEANINGAKWFCARITAISAGSVNVKAKLAND